MSRAYIAASRRSDRSLEARVESARRASEIHKRRTGRSLRVTEQDVINEEMYEEEDDDLPSQYRRLTAHLQTGSADFNRRLAAYLTNHVAMRSALDQAVNASYAQQFPNAPHFAHNLPGGFPSPFQPQANPQSPPQSQQPRSPHPYRQAPYPVSGMPGYRANSHHRSASMSTEKYDDVHSSASSKSPGGLQGFGAHRSSMSTPQISLSDVKSEATASPSIATPIALDGPSDDIALEQIQRFIPAARLSPFASSLPLNAQQLMGSALDSGDPFSASLMSGSENLTLPSYGNTFYNYMAKDIQGSHKDGLNATLAPAALQPSHAGPVQSDKNGVVGDPVMSGDFSLNFDGFNGIDFAGSSSEAGSASGTPGTNGGWDAFIDESSWAENGT